MKLGKLKIGMIAASLAFASAGSLPAHAASDSNFAMYFGFDIGAWKYWFGQEGNGQSVKHSGDVSLGFQMAFGARVSAFFIEYTPAYFISTIADDPNNAERDPNDASWATYKAGNVGISIPFIRTEVYAGGGHGCLDFAFGADSEYCGIFARAGIALVPGKAPQGSMRIKAEYTRQFISSDDAGSLPEGIDTSADAAFIAISFALGGK